MTVPTNLTLLRYGLAAGGLVALALIEQARPFRAWRDPRLSRLARNLFLAASNAAIAEIALGGSLVAMSAWLAAPANGWGLLRILGAGRLANIVASLICLDLATYLFHRAYHEVPVLWRLHRVHHADRDLDVTSASRFHAGEILLSSLYRLALMPLLGPSYEAVVVFEIALAAAAQFQHANLKLGDRFDRALRWLTVTPDMHRVHHSKVVEATNSNYATIFSIWDRLFASYRVEGIDQQTIDIGLADYARPEDVTLGRLVAMPFTRPPAA